MYEKPIIYARNKRNNFFVNNYNREYYSLFGVTFSQCKSDTELDTEKNDIICSVLTSGNEKTT